MNIKAPFFLCFFFSVLFSYGQLPDFNIKVDVANETCLGNGSLKISTSNTVDNAEITYLIYKLPNTTLPISGQANTTGLSAGTYRVIVKQTSGSSSNTQQIEVEIKNEIKDLSYSVTSSMEGACGDTSTIIINTLTGNPKNYEIIKGPVIIPPQDSNKFIGLPQGQYRIRVFDICGEAIVKDFTLVPGTSDLTIEPAKIGQANSCNNRDFINTVKPAEGNTISYPLYVKYTINDPNSTTPKIIEKTIASGAEYALELSINLPIYDNKTYSYDLLIKDVCGKTFSLNNNPVTASIILSLEDKISFCDNKYLAITIANFVGPYYVNFISAPSGFNPLLYNNNHPGPFSASYLNYENENKPVPSGTYTIQITDKCGRSATTQHEVKLEPLKPITFAYNAGCDATFGSIGISLPSQRKIVSAKIISAPAEYASTLPDDISDLIDPTGVILIQNLPLGFYDFIITDECDAEYFIEKTEIPPFKKQELTGETLPNCTNGTGSLTLRSGNGPIVSINITKAPTSFNKTFPYDVASFLYAGQLFMSDLPEGEYQFEAIDYCGYNLSLTMPVIGYNRTEQSFKMEPNCGSFNLSIADNSNGIQDQKFWLQKLNTTTQTWVHPVSENPYTEEIVPDDLTAINIPNNSTKYNLSGNGNYRVIKTFQSFANAAIPAFYKNCIEILGEFEYSDQLKIKSAFNLDCMNGGGASSIALDVLGIPPYVFKITEKDGDTTFTVNNGDNNVFNNLPPGTYNFQVEDKCGGLKNGKYTVGLLPKLVNANKPSDLLICGKETTQSNIFDLTQLASQILGDQNPDYYKISFHLSSADAETGNNPISNPQIFVNENPKQTIYVRVIHKDIDLCYNATSFEVYNGKTPELTTAPNVFLCEGETKTLIADKGYDAYEWSTKAETPFIVVSESGKYTVDVKNIYGNLSCESSKAIEVNSSGLARIKKTETDDWTDNSNSIAVYVTGLGNYEYSLDNENFQKTNTFSGLATGPYQIFIRDQNGCGTVSRDVVLLNYPHFFTPNGDGYNDRWKIEFSVLEPGITIYIYDRSGKLLTGLDANNPGWDGTYNGEPLPSTDYWFKAERADGEIYRGHFAMKR